MNIIKLASLSDKNGKYLLADKLDKIAQVAINDVLVSNDPSTFVTSLFNFARNKNINNLSQAFNAYSRAGAKYQNNPISTNKDTIRLYQYVVQNPRVLYPSQLVAVLQTDETADMNLQDNQFSLEQRANSDNLNNEAVPTNYNYYYNYLTDQGINRIAPVGTNNDNQRREPGFLDNQTKYYEEYKDNIDAGQDTYAVTDEINSDANLLPATRQKLLQYLGTKK